VVENVKHLFFECSTSVGMWQNILCWLKVSAVMHNYALDSLNQFADLIGSDRFW